MPSIVLPFSGFYESIWSHELDAQLEYSFGDDSSALEDVPDGVEIDTSDFWEFLDCRAAETHIARQYVAQFEHNAVEWFGGPLGLSFDDVDRPREYNFTTDRIFANISRAGIARLVRINRADNWASMRATVRKRFTSYDGFSSYYSPDFSTWPKPSEMDHNELSTLLLAAIEAQGVEDVEMACYYDMTEDVYYAFSEAFDWEKAESAIAEQVAEAAGEDPTVEARLDYRAAVKAGQLPLPLH